MHFIFDAQMPLKLAKGLETLDKDNSPGVLKIKTHHADEEAELGRGATDAQIIHWAGKHKAIIISEDNDFKRIRSNKQLLKQYKVGYILYKPPNHGSRYWEKVQAFILGWEKLKTKIEETNKPFILIINKKGEISEEFF